jgi:hypothetical protein
MPEIAIRLYGDPPTFDAKAGPLTALIEVEGGTSGYLLDRERGRARVAAFPGCERDRWTTPVGLLLAARRGWWGLSTRIDLILRPPALAPEPIDFERGTKRPRLPRDLASCPRCGLLVAVERGRSGEGFRLATPTRRLARRAAEVLAAAGIFPFVLTLTCKGRGKRAGRSHAADCFALPTMLPFGPADDPARPRRRPRVKSHRRPGRPRLDAPTKSPFPMAEAKAANRIHQATRAGKGGGS